MKRVLLMSSLMLASAVSLAIAQTTPATPQTAPAAAAATATVGSDVKRDITDVPVKRVVLFSSGVGFFQHSGKVSGNASTELRFKTDQINDILKTLVVSDTSGTGSVKSITYGSQNPIDRTLKSFQIDISSNPTMANILNQIRGTKVSLVLRDETAEGVILGVEEKERPMGTTADAAKVVKVNFVNLITATGIRSIQLDDVRRIEIQDEALQKELNQALAALAQSHDKDKKPVIVNFDGTGDRPVTLAYVVETPVWKSSYRLILPDPASQDKATLLGWAIVENQTDNDWNNITLDLVGGRPISFIEDLYRPLYVPRPRVQTKTYASLTPQTYEDGIETLARQSGQLNAPAAPGAAGGSGVAAGRGGGGRGGAGGGFGGAAPASAAPLPALAERDAVDAPLDFSQGIRSIAEAAKVGEMFQYSVKGVTLPRQRSSMIPIITEGVPFDRVSIYNRGVLARNPLLGVRLKNKTSNYLLAGPVAVMDKIKRADNTFADNYAGDATIDDVPPGQERLLSYAVDQQLLVDARPRPTPSRLMTGSILKGVLNLQYVDVSTLEYSIENKGETARTLLIEDPIEQGYTLKSPAKALEKTDRVYRFELPVPASQTLSFTVIEERTRGQTMAILNMDPGTIDFYSTTAEIPARVKEVLRNAGERRKAMVDLERRINQRNAERNQILRDEENIRQNIAVLPPNSKVRDDAIADLSAKDAELKKVNTDLRTLQENLEQARKDLENYLADMSVEGAPR